MYVKFISKRMSKITKFLQKYEDNIARYEETMKSADDIMIQLIEFNDQDIDIK